MNEIIKEKLATLPNCPGVYFHKDFKNEIIYIGKAAVLKNRVRQYFQKSRNRDPKTDALVQEIADIDWMTVDSEVEALFLEAELVRRYLPRYNILLRDDKAMSYIRIDYDSDYPTVTMTRRPLDDGAKYFGPYFNAYSIRQALKLLRRVFPYATKKIPGQKRATLHYHLGLDPGLEEGHTSLADYRANLRKLMAYIKGKKGVIRQELEQEMKNRAKVQDYEAAAKIRNQIQVLDNLKQQIVFSNKEFLDISKDHALNELVELFNIKEYSKRIEGYDISHMQGTDVVASMVVFTNGVSDKSNYRKFKTKKDHNNDFYNMHETIYRRFSDKNIKIWEKPQLVLIDGGKGQLSAAIAARDELGQSSIPFIGLAKREEQIVLQKQKHKLSADTIDQGKDLIGSSGLMVNHEVLQQLGGYMIESDDFILINLPHNTNLIKLLQRIRDESHRFAVSYHSVLKLKRQTSSTLEQIPGIGPSRRKKLQKAFGSINDLSQAQEADIAKVVGPKLAHIITINLAANRATRE